MIKTFTSPGRGRKQCPECEKYVGPVVRACPCGHEFNIGAKKEVVAKVFETPGRGRKQCVKCKKYIGARTIGPCPNCDYSNSNDMFVKAKSEDVSQWEDKKSQDDIRVAMACNCIGVKFVRAPGGDCPVSKPSLNFSSIEDFCDKLQNYGRANNKFYTMHAILYFGRNHFGFSGEDLELFNFFVDEWKNGKISLTTGELVLN